VEAPPVEAVPQVQPVVCNPVSFVVYFEWDKSNLTPEATAVIDRAVEQARQCSVNGVRIEGHADKSGAPRYNIGLSLRRGNIVKDALSARGVAAGAITVEGLGESRPAVDTPDGVREPLNRRSEVTITVQ
jgi:outer membrane protein OmpA-like peptidoglycan-associated protein